MKKLLLIALLGTSFNAYAGTGDVGTAREVFATRAQCSGSVYSDRDTSDRGSLNVQLRGDKVMIQADTSKSLKNFKEVYTVIDGKKGTLDSNNLLRGAFIFAKAGDVVISLTDMGYNAADQEVGGNINFDVDGVTYYGILKCDVVM